MLELFKTALHQVKTEEEEINIGKMLQSLHNKLENIEKQNEQLARGVVAVADMVEAAVKPARPAPPRPVPPPRAAPPMPAPHFIPREAPPAPPKMPPPPRGMPPPPGFPPPPGAPSEEPKKGLFGKIFKK